MNKKQLFVMWAGIIVIAYMGIFPPIMFSTNQVTLSAGYGFIGSQNIRRDNLSAEAKNNFPIDFTRLLTQWGIVSALTTGLIITFKDRKERSC